MSPPPFVGVRRELVKPGSASTGERVVPEETPIALTYGRSTYAVMMATPLDIEDFAIGFSLTERIVEEASEIVELEVVALAQGIEARMTLSTNRDTELGTRRRRIAGPGGCGLCGIESLEAAIAPPKAVTSPMSVRSDAIFRALAQLREQQVLNAKTHAVHAAGFWSPKHHRFEFVREDVGRHNALDKLVGAMARGQVDAADGLIVMSSRLSIELVQKAAAVGCPVVVAVSAPTAFALRAANDAGMTVVAVARDDSLEVFTHPERIEILAHHDA